MIENIQQIRQAIEVEQKNSYIDIRGRQFNFSGFILNQLHKLYKQSKKNPKWLLLIKEFETYGISSMPTRRKSVQRLVYTLKQEITAEGEVKQTDLSNSLKNPAETNVIYVKGVGPKIGHLLNKLGIFTARDLLFYFPKRHIDYSSRTLIKDIKENDKF